jgi:hypothetical protein
MTADPFMAPAVIPANFPTVSSLRGRLVLIEPLKQETVPNAMGAPGATQERVTANVTVVDGLGPVPQMKGNPAQPTGLMIDGPEWRGMWINSEVIVKQLSEALAVRGKVLATINVPNQAAAPGKGNAYGLVDPTDADRQTARNFLATRTIGAATAPAPQQAPAQAYAQQAAVYAQPQQPAPTFHQPSPVPPNAGPAPTPGINPFAR